MTDEDEHNKGETHGGLTLPVYAELSARLRAGGDWQATLARGGLSDAEWRVAKKEWSQAIDGELERGDDRLVLAFAAELERARLALAREAAPAAPTSAPRVELPSFLREQAPPRPTFLQEPPPVEAPLAVAVAVVPVDAEERTAYGPAPQIGGAQLPFVPAVAVVEAVPGTAPGPASSRMGPPSSRGFGPPPAPFAAPAEPAAPGPPAGARPSAPVGGETQALRIPRSRVAPSLTLEQYASLVVELELAPKARAATFARYLIADDDALASLEMSYRRRFGAEPGLLAKFSELMKRYREWKVGK